MVAITISIPALLVAMALFGFAPGAMLRIIVLAFPSEDPRRRELRAELNAIPRLERPLWVAEQIELAIFEGLSQRLTGAASGRVVYRWHLGSGVKANKKHPDTYWIPGEQSRSEVGPGYDVQLSFNVRRAIRHFGGARMWVNVTEVKGDKLVGVLVNDPGWIPRLSAGDEITFKRDNIINVHRPDWEPPKDADSEEDSGVMCECCFLNRNDPE